MFKVGQKVVAIISYVGRQETINEGVIYEVRHIINCPVFGLCISVNVDRNINWMDPHTIFRPIDESFAEEVLKNIKQQIEEEELVKN